MRQQTRHCKNKVAFLTAWWYYRCTIFGHVAGEREHPHKLITNFGVASYRILVAKVPRLANNPAETLSILSA